MNQHPKPWWYRLAERLAPSRCREIPEAQNPDRILLRQVAIVHRKVYLQQFASGEDPRFMHRHEFKRSIVLGLWGGYTERRLTGPTRDITAPYAYTMGPDVIHQVTEPTPGHTSILIGWGRIQERHYFCAVLPNWHWRDHVKQEVERI